VSGGWEEYGGEWKQLSIGEEGAPCWLFGVEEAVVAKVAKVRLVGKLLLVD
jgi:hypothetical protein